MKHLETVIMSGLFGKIKKTDYIEAFEHLKITDHSYSKGQTVFFEGDVLDKFCIVKKGSIRGEKKYQDGEVHIVEIFEGGSVFGLEISMSKKRTAIVDYVSNGETELVFISMSSIEKSRYSTQMIRAITFMLADDNIRLSHKIEILAHRGLRERVMAYLQILMQKAKGSAVTVPMNREQMAQFLCVNRSALSNELNKMKREGILDFQGKRFIVK